MFTQLLASFRFLIYIPVHSHSPTPPAIPSPLPRGAIAYCCAGVGPTIQFINRNKFASLARARTLALARVCVCVCVCSTTTATTKKTTQHSPPCWPSLRAVLVRECVPEALTAHTTLARALLALRWFFALGTLLCTVHPCCCCGGCFLDKRTGLLWLDLFCGNAVSTRGVFFCRFLPALRKGFAFYFLWLAPRNLHCVLGASLCVCVCLCVD